jgi:hypothetical protein
MEANSSADFDGNIYDADVYDDDMGDFGAALIATRERLGCHTKFFIFIFFQQHPFLLLSLSYLASSMQ